MVDAFLRLLSDTQVVPVVRRLIVRSVETLAGIKHANARRLRARLPAWRGRGYGGRGGAGWPSTGITLSHRRHMTLDCRSAGSYVEV